MLRGEARGDRVYPLWVQATNLDVYNGTIQDLVSGVLHGINTTVLAYGATGSGKTYTMVGTCVHCLVVHAGQHASPIRLV